MKKTFLAATAALALLASCSKYAEEITATASGSIVTVTLKDKTPQTRAFFDAAAAAESWEKKINTLTLFVFDANDNAVLRRNFTASEIAGQSATVPVPDAVAGNVYRFCVIANGGTIAQIATFSELCDKTEGEAAAYNGTFDEVTAKAKRAGGFTMSGMATKAIAQKGQTTSVEVSLERIVAKVAVQAATDSKFAAAYPGRVRIDNTTISRAASAAHYLKDVCTGGAFSHTQTAKEQTGKYGNLFYIYGNENSQQAVLLILEGIYDNDGNFSTTADQMPVTYEVELSGDTGKAIARNTYRRVTVNISGLTGTDIAVTITPADWEGFYNQDITIGM